MVGHKLIEAELAVLSARLPAQAVDELADGLWETYRARLALHGDSDAGESDLAAREAIAEFGDAELITTVFFRGSPWRQMVVTLLATGPVMAALWGGSLVAAQAWEWQIPFAMRMASGLVLLAIVATLLAVTRARRAYRRARGAAVSGAVALLMLDVGSLIALGLMMSPGLGAPGAPGAAWLLTAAAAASLARIILTLRALPSALSR
ncbi:hypothetical protein OIE66_06970 [Nonomuraea sp. NBC_01738]|uniref:hypothetical protein n=1 Tax=Nonomuraea sp. NBC_01738 TaxID=2976003 RepID=UPI002E0D1C10|nr:hypothetical protein OIE66_06970 [Nonomuraea sp. NBC_01738]